MRKGCLLFFFLILPAQALDLKVMSPAVHSFINNHSVLSLNREHLLGVTGCPVGVYLWLSSDDPSNDERRSLYLEELVFGDDWQWLENTAAMAPEKICRKGENKLPCHIFIRSKYSRDEDITEDLLIRFKLRFMDKQTGVTTPWIDWTLKGEYDSKTGVKRPCYSLDEMDMYFSAQDNPVYTLRNLGWVDDLSSSANLLQFRLRSSTYPSSYELDETWDAPDACQASTQLISNQKDSFCTFRLKPTSTPNTLDDSAYDSVAVYRLYSMSWGVIAALGRVRIKQTLLPVLPIPLFYRSLFLLLVMLPFAVFCFTRRKTLVK